MNLCLTAIVKDEAPVIERMLDSVLPHISYYSISDTGSTDGTQDIIRRMLKGVPGVLREDPWTDFATNRNLALSRAQGDFVITVDADEVLWRTGNDPIPDADRIVVKMTSGSIGCLVPRILRNDGKWFWTGVVHEIPAREGEWKDAFSDRFEIQSVGDGHQTAFGGKSEKYIALLRTLEPNSRNLFYLARTLFESERYEEALSYFERHLASDAPDEEKYVSLYQIAVIKLYLGQPALQDFARAHEFRPSRGEALLALHEMIKTAIQEHPEEHTDTLFFDTKVNRQLQEIKNGYN